MQIPGTQELWPNHSLQSIECQCAQGSIVHLPGEVIDTAQLSAALGQGIDYLAESRGVRDVAALDSDAHTSCLEPRKGGALRLGFDPAPSAY